MALSPEEFQKKLTQWKALGVEIPVKLSTQLNNTSNGHVYYREWTAKDKTQRAFKVLGTLWALATLSVFIPIAHFVLVPLFFISGPIAFAIVFNRENVILGGVAECPDCKQIFDIAKSKVDWPLKDICSLCYHQLTITNNAT